MTDLNAGTVVAGRYRIMSMIGSGGMANVYKAYDSVSRKNVALKVLKSEYAADAELVRRFRSEAQAVLNLSHDHIVRSYDVGQWEEHYFIVLEYVQGKTLKEIIAEEAPFERRRIISMGCQLCDALGHAHERNVVHRDVKPQNVIINDHGRPKVADFGIARFTDASTVTYTGDKILGSVHYVSPEQAKGELVDAKSDIYSLGIVLYEMATGHVPFDAENTVSVAIKHLQEEMVPPIVHNPKIGVALNGIILRATSKGKAARYSSMRELKKDLLRAAREPNVDFAGQEAKLRSRASAKKGSASSGNQKNQQASPFKRTMMLLIVMLITVGILLSFLLIGSALLNKNNGKKQTRYVPSLTGKTLAAATESAKSMGFSLVVRSRIVQDDIPADTVINQEPKAGNQGREGDTIYVDVSAGPATVEAPILTGLTVEEATIAAEEWGLSIAGITYEHDPSAELGRVIRQSPEAGTEMYVGDEIYIVVSGSEENMAMMPSLLGDKLATAIERLRASGFSRIFVRTVESDELPSRVVNQLPEGNTLQSADTTVELWVSPPLLTEEYFSDRAFNLDIPTNDSNVTVLLHSEGVYYILYENLLPAGQQTVSLTVRGDTEGPYEIIITINGEEVRRESVTLAKRKP
ncbi:MAG: Stk1 family PASTA domain-containing Ser/Thr kinase [Christensenellales bacterium]|jgi:serine/threonine protein kinase